MILTDQSLSEFCRLTSSRSPVPGGGSVSALCAALGASLAEMTAHLSLDKSLNEKAFVLTEAISRMSDLRERLLHYVDLDAASFDSVMKAYSLPKSNPIEQNERHIAIQNSLKKSCDVPLDVASKTLQIFPDALFLATKGNRQAITDILVCTLISKAAISGALLNVRINLKSIDDASYVKQMTSQVRSIELEANKYEKLIFQKAEIDF